MSPLQRSVVLAVIAVFAIVFFAAAEAEQTKAPSGHVTRGGDFVCTAKQDFKDLLRMVGNNDKPGVTFLIEQKRCAALLGGLRASLLETDFGLARIRVYAPDGGAVDFWANIEAVTPK